MPYNSKIIYFNNFFKNNIGNLNFYSYNSSKCLVGSVFCGDILNLKLFILNFFIYYIKFNIYGCGSAIAVINFISFYIKYKNIYQLILLKNIYISQELNLPPIKIHCSLLAESILILSIFDYKNNFLINK